MNDLIMIVIRFLLYLDLMVIFGLPFFQIYGISGVRHETYNLTNFRSFITFAVVTGIILTGINMLLVSVSLVRQERQGRTLFCHACYDNLAALIAFLTEECCADEYAPPGFMSPPEKK